MGIAKAERCSLCNHIVSEEGTMVCTQCGRKVVGPEDILETNPCRGCGHPMKPHYKFCPKCGASADGRPKPSCPQCGGLMEDLHCLRCGYTIATPPVCGIMEYQPPKPERKWWKKKKD